LNLQEQQAMYLMEQPDGSHQPFYVQDGPSDQTRTHAPDTGRFKAPFEFKKPATPPAGG
jgi:hypothetical protein